MQARVMHKWSSAVIDRDHLLMHACRSQSKHTHIYIQVRNSKQSELIMLGTSYRRREMYISDIQLHGEMLMMHA